MIWRSRQRANFCFLCLHLSHIPGHWQDLVMFSPQTSYLSHRQNNHTPRTGVLGHTLLSQEVITLFQNTKWSYVFKRPDMGTGIEIRSPGKAASYLMCWTISAFCSLWQHTHRTQSHNHKPCDALVSKQWYMIWSYMMISRYNIPLTSHSSSFQLLDYKSFNYQLDTT